MNEKKFDTHGNLHKTMRLTGAGVLVYSVHKDEILILLGREKYTPGWKQGSHKWSSFSGKVDHHENAVEGAAREFLEESCACVPIMHLPPAHVSKSDIVSILQNKAKQIEQISYNKGERLVYCTFITRIPYAPYNEVFQNSITKLHELDIVCRYFYRTWKLASVIPRFMRRGFELTSKLIVVNVSVINQTDVELVLHEENNDEDVVMMIEVEVDVIVALKTVQQAWDRVMSYLTLRLNDPILLHPAVNLRKSRQTIVSARVNKAFLEKCELRWWKLDDLLDIASTNNCNGEFRKLFLDNISHFGDQIKLMERDARSQK